jgi:hypothetical protein
MRKVLHSVPVTKVSFGDVEIFAVAEMQILAETRNNIQQPVSYSAYHPTGSRTHAIMHSPMDSNQSSASNN